MNNTAYSTQQSERSPITWWREARFGMFIHWGIYAATEGYWQGKETQGIGEHIQRREQIPLKEYAEFANEMTMDKFDANEYVALAKAAGMKYIIITAKHHDGFAMYNSKVSDYNIVKMGPSGRDPLRELSDAAREAGLTMGFYYSQTLDWEDPNAVGNDWDYNPEEKDFTKYLEGKCKPQLRELLTEYGPVGVIWFDVPKDITREQSEDLKHLVKSLQPDCLVSGRINREPGVGDYGSLGDNQIPAGRLDGDYETPVTLNDTWGYKRDDNNWKSPGYLIRVLVELAGKGANYLLNIGPRADGSIPEESIRILQEVGRWMDVNSEAVYGVSASPFPSDFEWGCAAVKDNVLYLYIFNWKSQLELAGLRNNVENAILLAAPEKPITLEQEHDANVDRHVVTLELPAQAPGEYVNVIRLKLDGSPEVIPFPCQQPDGSIHLPAYLAELHHADEREMINNTTNDNTAEDTAVAAENFNQPSTEGMHVNVAGVVENWFDTGSYISWTFATDRPGKYQLELRTFAKKYAPWVGGHKVIVDCEGQSTKAVLQADVAPDTTSRQYFNETGSFIGTIELGNVGRHTIDLKVEEINPDEPAGLAVSELILRKQQQQ